jgi:hypothetical protein
MNEIILRNMSEESKKNMTALKHTAIELTSGIAAGIAAATLSQVPISPHILSLTKSLRTHSCRKLIRVKVVREELYPVYILWARLPGFEDYLQG